MKQKEKLLLIDTAGAQAKVCIGDDCLSWPAQAKSELVLEKIDKLLKNHQITIADITAIKVNPGPGSFTGTRVGVSVANAISWANKKLVNGQKAPIGPNYGSPPHIT